MGDGAVIALEIVLDDSLPIGMENLFTPAYLAHGRKLWMVVEQQTFNLTQIGGRLVRVLVETDSDETGEHRSLH